MTLQDGSDEESEDMFDKIYIMILHKNPLSEMVLMQGHKLQFYREV